jgi:cytochrome c oxidase assembly factor CtaG
VNPYAWPVDAEALAVPLLAVGYFAFVRPRRSRAIAFVAVALLLLAVFATPLHTIAVRYLVLAHFLQNVVVAEWAPALAVVALSGPTAQRLEAFPATRPLTHPLVALPVWLATYAVWHVPTIYDSALRHPHSLLHLEHASYFVAGCCLWWPVVHGRHPDGVKALYLFAAFVLASPLGLLLALLPHPVYAFYASAPRRLWGLSRIADQQIAGLTMAVEQAVVFFAVFAVYLLRFLRHEAITGTFSEIRR